MTKEYSMLLTPEQLEKCKTEKQKQQMESYLANFESFVSRTMHYGNNFVSLRLFDDGNYEETLTIIQPLLKKLQSLGWETNTSYVEGFDHYLDQIKLSWQQSQINTIENNTVVDNNKEAEKSELVSVNKTPWWKFW
jgi:hypothetical protein